MRARPERESVSAAVERRTRVEERRHRYRIIFGGIIAATLPFYCAGAILWAVAPRGVDTIPTNTPTATRDEFATEPPAAVTQTPTNTVIATFTPAPVTATPTSGFGVPATAIPRVTNTPTRTNTPIPTNTPAATNTPIPTNTSVATNTPVPTNAPAATATLIPFGSN